MIPSERLKGIEAFVCTADAGSFTAAGVRLNHQLRGQQERRQAGVAAG